MLWDFGIILAKMNTMPATICWPNICNNNGQTYTTPNPNTHRTNAPLSIMATVVKMNARWKDTRRLTYTRACKWLCNDSSVNI